LAKRGLAGLLMQRVLDWAANSGLETIVLHASDDGRRLYKRLGFIPTNEMRYPSALLRRPKDNTR
jgi:predicted N-acetyltransferase YhbS